ncbi:hypothetical protein EKH57_08885 [Halorubrum sp. BOL3-1]|uniref:hypothetical protein n=1 Tax=Halorubrum sp. BOL3-1 TaxID=2497325 RepID=UPI001004DC3F|nr:hypothetical protein [Halorubrum sp. BOL3-1]QAU12832.1 hypothetical protein EKH57_08885 [Halorubrum sp. BOL3-1]
MGDRERNTDARIAIDSETREQLRDQKRGGETYDRLLRKMIRQYDPDADPARDGRVAPANG